MCEGVYTFFGIFSLCALGTFYFIFFSVPNIGTFYFILFFSVPNIGTFYHFFHNVAGVAVGAALATI